MKIDDAVKSTGVPENEFENVQNSVSLSLPSEDESGFRLNLSWLKTETGPGEIEDYINHPLNFLKSRGFAQILRGVTGFFGNLKLAVIDIVLGILNFLKERKAGENAGNGNI